MIVQLWSLPYASGQPGLKTHGPSTWQGPSTWNNGGGGCVGIGGEGGEGDGEGSPGQLQFVQSTPWVLQVTGHKSANVSSVLKPACVGQVTPAVATLSATSPTPALHPATAPPGNVGNAVAHSAGTPSSDNAAKTLGVSVQSGGDGGVDGEGGDGKIGKGASRTSIGVVATTGRKRAEKASLDCWPPSMLASKALE